MSNWKLSDINRIKEKNSQNKAHMDGGKAMTKEVGRKSKHGSRKVVYDGITFDSIKEGKRYLQLQLLIKAGYIKDFERQVKYELIAANDIERACSYYADFRYTIVESGVVVVEDTKSAHTRKLPTYIIKRKLMLAIHKIQVLET